MPTTDVGTETTAAPSTATPTTAPNETAEPYDLDSQLAWMLQVLNGLDPTADEYEARFGSSFQAQVSFAVGNPGGR